MLTMQPVDARPRSKTPARGAKRLGPRQGLSPRDRGAALKLYEVS